MITRHKFKVHKKLTILTLSVFLITLGSIIVLIVLPKDFWEPRKKEWTQSRIIVPNAQTGQSGSSTGAVERMIYEANIRPEVPLSDGEIQIIALAEDLDGDGAEEQVIAYRNLLENDNPVYITYIDYDTEKHEYHRAWSVKTPITRPQTVSLFTIDLLGNHSNCVVITGLNQKDENILNAFRIFPAGNDNNTLLYKRIAEITIDGTIAILETERSQAYQMGFAQGASFLISDRGHDPFSTNELDQIEHNYAWDPIKGSYERISTTRIPGAQIEERLLRELRNGGKQEFERFIDGLWYHINAEGAIDTDQYLYFDTSNREVNFYSEDTQQVYGWQSSYATRYGLFISSQNISVSTLNRKIDIELESIDSIRIRVSEDVRMRILMNALWDGSYRKAKTLHGAGEGSVVVLPSIEAEYNSPMGKIYFTNMGIYRIEGTDGAFDGNYAFFKIGANELLELVPSKEQKEIKEPKRVREIYRVERRSSSAEIALMRVKLGINGIYEFHEPPVMLN